jgi:ubiquinone/menaquinone biosynthesis C-methylase UbiE
MRTLDNTTADDKATVPVAATERYLFPAAVQHQYVATRKAAQFVPFLLPHLRAGMSVLDCGCGTGSMTLDLARRVAPGRVAGVDVDEAQLAVASASARELALEGVEFTPGSVYELPFADATFDVVVANTVLFHLSDPVRALTEMRRVLRPGGIAAVSDDDLSTVVYSPELPELGRLRDVLIKALRRSGASPSYSRHLRALMRQAGFEHTEGFGLAPETYGGGSTTRAFATKLGELFGSGHLRTLALAEGWMTEAELSASVRTLEQWGLRPDAFVSWLYCAALGWKGERAAM